MVIRLTECAFGKQDQRPPTFDQNVDTFLDGLSINSFSIDTESAQSSQQPGQGSTASKQMGAGHDKEGLIQLTRQAL